MRILRKFTRLSLMMHMIEDSPMKVLNI